MTERLDLIKSAGQKFGAHPALIEDGREISFAQLDTIISQGAKTLLDAGIKPNDRVGIKGANSADYVSLFLALMRMGGIACPMSVRFPSVLINNLVDQIGVSAVVSDRPIELTGRCRNILLEDICSRAEDVSIESKKIEPVGIDQIATIMFTSGSIATPRPVCHTLGNHYYNALGANENIPFGPCDRWLLSLPLYHVGGLGVLFRSLIGGGAIVFPNTKLSLTSQIKNHAITHLSVVSTQLRELLKSESPDRWYRSLKAVIVGGGPQDKSLLNSAREIGLPIATTYGLTEMASQVTCSIPTSEKILTNHSGRLLGHRELKISDSGEILVRGDCLMKGWPDKKNLTSPFDPESWYHTGDRGELSDDGDLTVLGRLDSMFISGGENIFPEQIEAALLEIESVEQVIVVPVADKKFGHRPVAFVKCSPHPTFALDELVERLSSALPPFMIPIRFFPWPRSLEASGLKPSRSRLKQIAEQAIQSGA